MFLSKLAWFRHTHHETDKAFNQTSIFCFIETGHSASWRYKMRKYYGKKKQSIFFNSVCSSNFENKSRSWPDERRTIKMEPDEDGLSFWVIASSYLTHIVEVAYNSLGGDQNLLELINDHRRAFSWFRKKSISLSKNNLKQNWLWASKMKQISRCFGIGSVVLNDWINWAKNNIK